MTAPVAAAPPVHRLLSREMWTRRMRQIALRARARPTTTIICVVTTIVSLVAYILPHSELAIDPLEGSQKQIFEEPHWWGALASMLAVGDILSLLYTLPLIMIAISGVERLLGSRLTVVAYFGGGMCVSVVGNTVGSFEENQLKDLLGVAPSVTMLSPSIAVLCTVVTASAFAGPLWRRRIRVLATGLSLMLFLYSGTANDLFALVSVPVGLALGFLLGGKRAGVQLIRSSHHETRLLLALVGVVSAVGPVIATLLGNDSGLLGVYGQFADDQLSTFRGHVCGYMAPAAAECPYTGGDLQPVIPFIGLTGLMPVSVLLLASWGMARGRREALYIAVALNLLIFASFLPAAAISALLLPRTETDVRNYLGAFATLLLPLGNTLMLIALRRHFRMTVTRASIRRSLAIVMFAAVGTLCLVGLIQFAGRDQLTPRPSLLDILASLPLRLVPSGLQGLFPLTFVPDGAAQLVTWYLAPIVFWGAVLWATARLVVDRGEAAGATGRSRARALLEQGGGDTLSFMTTWSGNAYWFAPDADAAIAYRRVGSTVVTLGGPFGPDHQRPGLIEDFVRHCGDGGWTPLFYSVDDDIRLRLEQYDWRALQVAEEALLTPADWTPAGKKRQDIRTATNRANRANIRATWTSWSELNLRMRSQLTALSEAWVSEKELPEMGFTLGGLDELTDPAVRLMLAIDEQDQLQAVTSWLPHYGAEGVDGYTLDFMRRASGAMPGITEFVIGAALERMKADGIGLMSLSGAPLARSQNPEEETSSVVRLLDALGKALEPAYGFRSLLAFKRKFQPDFEPRWLMYPDATALPVAGLAITRSYMPQLTLRGAARLVRDLGSSQPARS
ncbi:bifunctional lysylphosphatidylglycerol flippase/synthetase MprF [Clavibacter sp. VKM Ac-2872]|uniref:bifunctional lysylphosphatidylglycerol flippase/synthetase MprF n=1 Tax=Clavibacter sp. VKM Ac-2872 TaxID=2783812 RepID=UPI00188CA757|nr:DUF2156 domain-containing protein [Clavibacter sp. VKM Ac-2872]MBF4625763.1 DUF2156 domain-containing protein [Clavibacter sp. VKM Ac-2872]